MMVWTEATVTFGVRPTTPGYEVRSTREGTGRGPVIACPETNPQAKRRIRR